MSAYYFNVEKYQALAYGTNPKGLRLADQVEAHWNEWLQIVKEAKWLKFWVNYDKLHQAGCTPKGRELDDDWALLKGFKKPIRISNIALLIYTNAVWGWGIEDWLHHPEVSVPFSKPINKINKSIIDARKGVRTDKQAVQDLYTKEGYILPEEYKDLDQWLEKLWNDICIER